MDLTPDDVRIDAEVYALVTSLNVGSADVLEYLYGSDVESTTVLPDATPEECDAIPAFVRHKLADYGYRFERQSGDGEFVYTRKTHHPEPFVVLLLPHDSFLIWFHMYGVHPTHQPDNSQYNVLSLFEWIELIHKNLQVR